MGFLLGGDGDEADGDGDGSVELGWGGEEGRIGRAGESDDGGAWDNGCCFLSLPGIWRLEFGV